MTYNFQSIVEKLHNFWRQHGCTIVHPYDIEKGAATLSPDTFLRSLGPEPWSIAHVDPCRRPIDSRYAEGKTDRYQRYYQYQVLIKPAIDEPQNIVLESLSELGLVKDDYKIEFIDDYSESPIFGAKFRGWELWIDGLEVAQISYLDQVGGIDCNPLPLEITYGLERLALKVQRTYSFKNIQWSQEVTYGELYEQAEREQSIYNHESSSPEILKNLLNLYVREVEFQLQHGLVYPSLDYLLKSSHTLNLLEVRKSISKADMNLLIQHIRSLATQIGNLYIRERELLGFPLIKD